MLDVCLLTGDEVVNGQNPVPVSQVTITQMGPDKAGAAGNEDDHRTLRYNLLSEIGQQI